MRRGKDQYTSIGAYVRTFPLHVQRKLQELREIIRAQAPGAQEKISYQMPAFFLNGNLVYFAAYAKHIGFYPGANSIKAFKRKLSKYKSSKGAVQFPIEEPLPKQLIKQMVRFKLAENLKKAIR